MGGGGVGKVGVNMAGGVAVVGVVVTWVKIERVVGGGGVGWTNWLSRFNSDAVLNKVLSNWLWS